MSDEEEEYMEGEEEENLEEEEADGEEGLAEEEDIEEGEEEDKDVTQEDEFVEEEEEREPPNPLTEEMMRDSLSMLTQIGTGLSHAFVRLDVHDKAITDISVLKKYIHLRYVTLTTNAIRDISPLGYLSHLLIVRAEQNRLNSAKIDELPYLQLASFSGNNVKSMEGINHPMLEKLFLAYNQIEKISGFDPVKIGNLRVLDLRANRLESTVGIYPPNLRELYLPTNLIKSLEGISSLVNLQILHLRDNQIETLDGFSEDMVSLQYLNLRSNNVQDFSEISKVTCLPALKVLVLCENPIAEEEEYRLEVYIQIGESLMLDRLDKEPFAMEEIEEATELMEQRLQEQMSKEPSDVTREPTNITVTSTSSRGKSSLRS